MLFPRRQTSERFVNKKVIAEVNNCVSKDFISSPCFTDRTHGTRIPNQTHLNRGFDAASIDKAKRAKLSALDVSAATARLVLLEELKPFCILDWADSIHSGLAHY